MAAIPPWLIPADPAGFAARGMALGLQASGQRAENAYRAAALQERSQAAAADLAAQEQARAFEQQFRMQQAARAEQQNAQEMALAQQQHQLAAQAAGKKFEAMQNYENAVKGGMDPNSAILLYGPAMGQSTAEAAVIRANAMRKPPAPATWEVKQGPGGEKAWVSSAGGFHMIPAPKAATAAKPAMTETSRWNLIDRTNKEIEKIHEAATMDLTRPEPDPKWNEKTKADFKRFKSALQSLERQRDILQSGFAGGGAGAMMPPGMEDQGAAAPDSGGKPALRIVSIERAEPGAGPLMTAGAIRPPAGDEGSE